MRVARYDATMYHDAAHHSLDLHYLTGVGVSTFTKILGVSPSD